MKPNKSIDWRRDTRPKSKQRPSMCLPRSIVDALLCKPGIISSKEQLYTIAEKLYRKSLTLQKSKSDKGDYDMRLIPTLQAGVELGYYKSFKQIETTKDLISHLSNKGPVISAAIWHEGSTPGHSRGRIYLSHHDPFITYNHSVLIDRISPEKFWFTNHWGKAWGNNGSGWLPIESAGRLLVYGKCYVIEGKL